MRGHVSPLFVRVPLMAFLALLIAGVFLLLSPSLARTDTPWPKGWINSDTTQTAAGTSYILNGEMTVAGGDKLTAQSGGDVGATVGGPYPAGSTSAPEAVTVLRTLAYHQITAFTSRQGFHTGGYRPSMLSADGSRAAFLMGSEPVHVFVVDADGSNLREVDTHPGTGNTNVEISADGSKVLSWYGESGPGAGVARIVNADGSDAHTVLAAGNGKFFRLSADGSKVYFASGGNFDFGGTSHNAGLYVINADGSGLQQILDRAQVHALFGKPIPELGFYWGGTVPFAISDDGSQIVLQVYVQDIGYPIMRVNGDGTGLQAYSLFSAGYYSYVANLGISGDGTKVFYELIRDPWELGVFNWDGSGKLVLASGVGGANTGGEIVQLTYDGTKLSYGSLNRLYNTDGSGVLQLAATGPTLYDDPPLMVGNWGLFRSSMNHDATRFLFTFDNNTWVGGVKQPEQLGILDLNPLSLGQSPSLTDPTIAPSYLVIGDGSTTAFSVRMSTANTHLRTNSVVFRDGLEMPSNVVNDAVLYDDGSNGDAVASDGRFTYSSIRANTGATAGPHTVRMKTEVRAADGRRHAMALDVAQLDVVTEPPPDLADLTVRHLEVTQAIQSETNGMGMIEYKRTVVRAYMDPGVASGPVGNVTARLVGYRGTTPLGTVAPFNPRRRITVVEAIDWRQINQTLNFEVPFSWLTGDVRLEVEVNHDKSVTESNYNNNVASVNVHFWPSGGLRIAWMPIHYTPAGYTGPTDPTARIAQGDAWLKTTWPLSHSRVQYYPWPGITYRENVNEGWGATHLIQYVDRLLRLSQAQPPPDHVYGWLPGGVYEGNGLGYLPGQAAFGNDTDGRWRRTFAHELGHNRHLGHWDAMIAWHGFDVAAREVKVETKLDFMVPGRLESEAWIAPGTYIYLYDHMNMASLQSAAPAAVEADEYLLGSGLINQNGTGSLDTFYRQVQTDPLPNPPEGTAYCLELLGAGSAVLASQCFDLSFDYGDSTTPMTTAPFALSVPYSSLTTQIVLRSGATVLASRAVSSHAPTVSVSSPGGDVVKTLNWTAGDLDGDVLTYSVMYSPDNKGSWYALATDLTQASYSLDTSVLPGGTTAYVRILASDGVNTGQGDAGPFAVGDKQPGAVINAPADLAVYPPGENVLFAGDGFDLEDGSLPEGSLTWSSDMDGPLGSGRTLERSDLSEGKHTITLDVSDSQGKHARASITLKIGPAGATVYLPTILR
jgi:hypothetical protein